MARPDLLSLTALSDSLWAVENSIPTLASTMRLLVRTELVSLDLVGG